MPTVINKIANVVFLMAQLKRNSYSPPHGNPCNEPLMNRSAKSKIKIKETSSAIFSERFKRVPIPKMQRSTVFEKHKKSHFTTKVHKNAKIRPFGGHKVLPERSILIGQKLMEKFN